MKKLIPTALIAVLLLFMGYAGYRYYMEEVKPIEDIKKDMAEQRELFDSIRPEAMPFDFSIEPETASPLPTDGFYSPEDLQKIYADAPQPETNLTPETSGNTIILETTEMIAISENSTPIPTTSEPENIPENETVSEIRYIPESEDIPPIQNIPQTETISESLQIPSESQEIPISAGEVSTALPPPSTSEAAPENIPSPSETAPENIPSPVSPEPETATPTQQPEDSPLEEVKEVNRQAIAWLTIPDTDLDYPIAQADDNEFYLWKGFNGQRNGTGTPFLDYRCKPDFSGYNSIIYGHNMEQMLMFATVRFYRDKAFMEEHPEGWLLLDDGLHKIQFFAFLSVQGDSAIYQTVFASPQEFEEYKDLLFDLAKYTMNVPEEINHVVLLSTCTFERENQRGVVVGKLT